MSKGDEYTQVIIPADMERYVRQAHRLNFITRELVSFVNDKDIQYGSSWRKRGGPGAFFVIARKWDRIEQACETEEFSLHRRLPGELATKYDIFDRFSADDRSETILDDCLDLVGYLLILIEHMVEVGHITKIEALRMSFVSTPTAVEAEPSGMLNPHGFEEEEEDLIEDLILDTRE